MKKMKKFTKRDILNILGARFQNGAVSSNGNRKSNCQNDTHETSRHSKWERFISIMKDIHENVTPVLKDIVDMVVNVIKALKPSPVNVSDAR